MLKPICSSDKHPTIRTLQRWLTWDQGGVFYERWSGWSCGLNWWFWSWALPLSAELSRVWSSGPDGKAPWGISKISLSVRVLFLSIHWTLWVRRAEKEKPAP